MAGQRLNATNSTVKSLKQKRESPLLARGCRARVNSKAQLVLCEPRAWALPLARALPAGTGWRKSGWPSCVRFYPQHFWQLPCYLQIRSVSYSLAHLGSRNRAWFSVISSGSSKQRSVLRAHGGALYLSYIYIERCNYGWIKSFTLICMWNQGQLQQWHDSVHRGVRWPFEPLSCLKATHLQTLMAASMQPRSAEDTFNAWFWCSVCPLYTSHVFCPHSCGNEYHLQ